MQPLSAAVVGVGYLGRFHAQKYAVLSDCELIAVVDNDPARAHKVAQEVDTQGLSDYRQLLGRVDAVSIVTPTTQHFAIAKEFLAHGSHVLVEKPITTSVQEATELVDLAAANNLVLQVGHLERFNLALMAIQDKLTQPLFIESHRLAPFNPRSLDVSVVLDLMIHDIDIILSIMRCDVTRIAASGVPVLSNGIDIANARLEFSNGCVANVTASRVAVKSERKMRFFQTDSCFTVDFQNRELSTHSKGDKEMYPGIAEIVGKEQKFGESDAIKTEIEAFLHSVRTGQPPVVSGEDGKRALETAIAITEVLK